MTISPERFRELQSRSDDQIDLSDIPELDENFWNEAEMVEPQTKQAISIRIDRHVLNWFKSQGKGYQSLMNSVLKSYVEHQNKLSK